MRGFGIIIIIIVMVMVIGMKDTCECCLAIERNGLLQINSSIPLSLWSPWGSGGDDDCCNWEGIECDNTTRRVTRLYLWRDSSLGEWYLNASLFLPFQQLNELDLSRNSISGCIHNEGFERLWKLTDLKVLDLSSNNFNSSILQSLSGFSSLKSLYLESNKLMGTTNISGFEKQWKFTTLEILDLTGNKCDNSILQYLSGIPSLKFLILNNNKLHGTINISEFNNLTTTLQELHLAENEIEGFQIEGFEMLRPLTNLELLDLSYNNFNNSILQYLIKFPSLKYLVLDGNNLGGTINITGGEKFPTFNSLKYLELRNNYLNNNVFQSIRRMSSLKSLSLSNCGLSGKLPASQGLCNLKQLEVLDIGLNYWNGTLPWCLSNLTSLQELDLSYNQFTGNIYPIQGLPSLKTLIIMGNDFLIPLSLSPLFNLSQLTDLTISMRLYADKEDHSLKPKFQLENFYMVGYGSEVAGSMPEFLYHQNNLETLQISNIKLTGGFPYWLLENNTRLSTLELSNTSLSGNLLLPTLSHANLTNLDISANFFHGYIPSQMGVYFPRIVSLIMSMNELNGSLPGSLCNTASSMLQLDISHNNISGTIPQCIGNMSYLRVLDLSSNNISGSLTFDFNSPSLGIVNLSKNRLQGSLKDVFHSTNGICLLDLSHNSFSGSIPLEFGKLPHLSLLVLGNNNFDGEIPIELCKLQLSLLDLSHNKFFGHVLPCLNITSSFSRERDRFYTIEPLEITVKGQTYLYETEILIYMTGIDMSCNNLTGKIPLEIGDLRNIKALNLSYNSLIGPIPPIFSNLKEIESLDLSHNSLQGTIPHQLVQLTSLEVFDVSYNNLSGRTPGQVAQFLTFNESSFEGNPFLCGFPLSKSCGPPDSSSKSNAASSLHDDKSIIEFIDMEFFYVSFGVAYVVVLLTLVTVLCINSYWRRVWFYYVQMSIDKTYYFINDNVLPLFSRF